MCFFWLHISHADAALKDSSYLRNGINDLPNYTAPTLQTTAMFIVTAVSAYQTTSPPHSRRRQCSLSQPFQPDIKTEGFSFSDMITADRSARALSSILNGVLAVGATCCSENASFCAHDSFLLLRQRNHIAPLAVLCGNVQRDCRDRVCMGFWKLILPGTE